LNKPFYEQEPELNVFGQPLQPCSTNPVTGFFRTGNCSTGPADEGRHTVCAEMTDAFLEFSKSRGNDLSTPMPEYAFPGLKAGDRWCLVASRWMEALQAGMAPRIVLGATHQSVLRHIEIEVLKKYAIDLS
jgi:hypothetical protein